LNLLEIHQLTHLRLLGAMESLLLGIGLGVLPEKGMYVIDYCLTV